MERLDIKQLQEHLQETSDQLEKIEDPVEINHIIETLIKRVTGAEYASLWIFHQDKALLRRERNDDTPKEISMLGQQGVLAKCFFTLSSGIYNYLASEKGYFPEVDNPDNIKIKSKIIVPIIDEEHFLGMVTAYTSVRKIKSFDHNDIALLEAMVPFLANVIYRIYPEKKAYTPQVYTATPLRDVSKQIVEKAAEIENSHQQEHSIDQHATFLANTVHDIRTPANTLFGFLELLEEKIEDNRLLQYIKNAKESAHFINELTTSILDQISNQTQISKHNTVQVAPTKFFADIAEGFSANMSQKSLTYNIYIDPFMPKEAQLDTQMLKRVLMNLLNNAYKFTPSDKSVELLIKFDAKRSRLFISVNDTGIGIAKEKQAEIFEAFKQAEETTKEQYGGTGLGLSICASYVKSLGGELQLRSTPDKGSSFYFDIPIECSLPQPMFPKLHPTTLNLGIILDKSNIESSKNILRYLSKMGLTKAHISVLMQGKSIDDSLTHLICFEHLLTQEIETFIAQKNIPLLVVEETFLSMLDEKESNQKQIISQYGYYAPKLHKFVSDNQPKRVLVVDDDKINIELIKAILSESFCQIDTAQDGERALKMLKEALLQERPYAIAFLDKHMPKLSGEEVISKFRKIEKESISAPIYAVSISGESIEDQHNDLFDNYVTKPFNQKRIKEILQEVL